MDTFSREARAALRSGRLVDSEGDNVGFGIDCNTASADGFVPWGSRVIGAF